MGAWMVLRLFSWLVVILVINRVLPLHVSIAFAGANPSLVLRSSRNYFSVRVSLFDKKWFVSFMILLVAPPNPPETKVYMLTI